MTENRQFAEKIAARGDDVYGLTTGVGMRKKRKITDATMVQFNSRMIAEHATGQGYVHTTPPLNHTAICAVLLLSYNLI